MKPENRRILKAENTKIEGLNNKEAVRIITQIATEQKWKWWIDNEGKLIIDLENSLDMGE